MEGVKARIQSFPIWNVWLWKGLNVNDWILGTNKTQTGATGLDPKYQIGGAGMFSTF